MHASLSVASSTLIMMMIKLHIICLVCNVAAAVRVLLGKEVGRLMEFHTLCVLSHFIT
jgi:hypothetical protein